MVNQDLTMFDHNKSQESSGQELFGHEDPLIVKSIVNHGHAKMIVDNNDNECFHD